MNQIPMITTKDRYDHIKTVVKALTTVITAQNNLAFDLGVKIETIKSIALNKGKQALVAWYNQATKTIKLNEAMIASKQAEIKEEGELRILQLKENGVILNNSDFGKYALTGSLYHRYWLAQKDAHQDKLLFIRLGDFTWTFAGDAVRSMKTIRDKHLGIESGNNYKVAIWGFPNHATSTLNKLILARYQVEILEPAIK